MWQMVEKFKGDECSSSQVLYMYNHMKNYWKTSIIRTSAINYVCFL